MKRLGCTSAIVLFLFAAVIVSFFLGDGEPAQGGVKDASGRGHLALLLLLKETGFDPAVRTGSPKELAQSGPGLVILPGLPSADRRLAAFESAFSPDWFGTFVERGGDLIVPVSDEGGLQFLRDALELSETGVELDLVAPKSELEVTLPSAQGQFSSFPLKLHADDEPLLEVTTFRRRSEPFVTWPAETSEDDGEPVLAVVLPRGLGRIVALAVPSAFQNQLLPEADNALFFVRLIEYLQAGKVSPPVPTFDQYAVLDATHDSWVRVLFQPPALMTTLIVLLVLGVWAWSLSARHSFPIDRRLARRPPPAERARALASLMVRAGHPEWIDSSPMPPLAPEFDD